MRCPTCNTQNPETATNCISCGVVLPLAAELGDEALPPGTTLDGGRYSLGRVLGRGGFGITYLGSETQARQTVAIKELFPFGSARRGAKVVPRGIGYGDFLEAVRRFRDEANTLQSFDHPQIVDVYTVFEENDTVYMAMEYLQGKTLLEMLQEERALGEAKAIEYTIQVGYALDAMHRASLLHRDIKPSNVIVTNDGRVVLFDFGTVRAFAGGQTSQMTAQLTPGYAPLEQYGRNARFGSYTDIYALGAMLYHLLTGEMPLPATDRAGGEELRPPHHVNPAISNAASEAVMWAMEMKIDRRPQSVGGFIEVLRRSSGMSTIIIDPAKSPTEVGGPPLAEVPKIEISPACEERRDRLTKAINNSPLLRTDPSGAEPMRVTQSLVKFPKMCACCGGKGDTFITIQAPLGESAPYRGWSPNVDVRQWEVPYCYACTVHYEASRNAKTGWRWIFGATAVCALSWPLTYPWGPGVAACLGVYCVPHQYVANKGAKRAMRENCCTATAAVDFGYWDAHGIVFHFYSTAYASAFRHLNAAIVSPEPAAA